MISSPSQSREPIKHLNKIGYKPDYNRKYIKEPVKEYPKPIGYYPNSGIMRTYFLDVVLNNTMKPVKIN